jgi:uncharacterized protein (TIGR01777 family)
MSKKILITGASGLIGSRLTEMLLQKGYQVAHLGRSSKKKGNVESFTWDIEKQGMDPLALKDVDAIIHLAGAGVADKRWTKKRKHDILESRINSTRLLFDTLSKTTNSVKSFISASAIGYYGFGLDEKVYNESDNAGMDFLASVTERWEREVDKVESLGIRVAKLRIGIVLSEKGGALKQMALPVNFFVGAPLGSGKQYLSWIHIDDLCAMFIKALDDENVKGAYNAVCDWVTNKLLTKSIANVLRKPIWVPIVPGFVLKIVLGEMANMVLNGSKVSSTKIRETGFVFQFENLDEALKNLLLDKKE